MKKTMIILGAGALTLSLFGCSSEQKSMDDVSKTSDKEVVLSREDNKKQLSSKELFRKTVEQATGSHYSWDNMNYKAYGPDNTMGEVFSIDKGNSYSDQQADKRLLILAGDLLNEIPSLNTIYLEIPLDNGHKVFYVDVNKKLFNQWIGFDIENDNNWKDFRGDIDKTDVEEFSHIFVGSASGARLAFQKTVEQATGSVYSWGDIDYLNEPDDTFGVVTINKGNSYSDEQAHKMLLTLTCELLNKNPKLNNIYLEIPQDNDQKVSYVEVNRKSFNHWTGLDIEDDNEWKTFCKDIDGIVVEEFFHKFGKSSSGSDLAV